MHEQLDPRHSVSSSGNSETGFGFTAMAALEIESRSLRRRCVTHEE
jgi:hypothetical protein